MILFLMEGEILSKTLYKTFFAKKKGFLPIRRNDFWQGTPVRINICVQVKEKLKILFWKYTKMLPNVGVFYISGRIRKWEKDI